MRQSLHLPSEDEALIGKHILIVDTERCPGTAFLLYGLLSMPEGSAHMVCLAESPLHYRHLYHKYGGSADVLWTDLSANEGTDVADRLVQTVEKEQLSNGRKGVVVDSWFPLQCCGQTALQTTQLLRRLRKSLGATGTLVSLLHGDAMTSEQMALFVYEADLVMHVREVASSGAEVTGRVSLTWRGQVDPQEALFTVLDNHIVFRPV